MKIFRKILKNKLFYLVLLLGVFLTPIFKFTLQAQEVENVDYSNKNLVIPNLEDKEYLGDGVYRLYNDNGITFDYNIYNGIFIMNGVTTPSSRIEVNSLILDSSNYTYQIISLNEGRSNSKSYPYITTIAGTSFILPGFNDSKTEIINQTSPVYIRYFVSNDTEFNNYQFRLQLEKGTEATPYTVPLQPYLWHEKRIAAYEAYWQGFDSGANEGYDIGYNDGYQDGEGDTHDYYDNNGLFIPKTTPKAHLMIDYDQRYGEPYFYLQDFSGNYDNEYFGFPHNRWLENAFNRAYSIESDFLAINDLYTLKYESDEVIYKYFFYKYDTDSIYFYNDNGTLLKIVDRALFDYYIYEVPELSQEEQARIDNAYTRGMWDYGYYDNGSEEYLTAIEYGEIRYNQGVISTRDKAYSDGFTVALRYSHQYGYDWVRVNYYELFEDRPILANVTDITSFTYQTGFDEGFDEGEVVGYDKGYDVGLDDGYDNGLYDGFDDGYEVGYWKGYDIAIEDTPEVIYDEIYNKGYRDGQKTGMNNKFYTGLEKWIVPAIIVVLFFGLLMLFPRNKED